MSVNWEGLDYCPRCTSPRDKHHESCIDHPLGWQGRQDVRYAIEDGETGLDMDWSEELSDCVIIPEKVVRFAEAVIEAKLYRITQPCPECAVEERRICMRCDHPQGAHGETGVCKMFPVCPCDRFDARDCPFECRGERIVPEALIDAALIEMPPLGEPSDSIARALVREALYSVEAVAQQLVEEPQL